MSFDLFGALSPSTDDPNRNMRDELETHKKTDGDEDIDHDIDHLGTEQHTASGPRQVSQVEVEGSTPQYEGTFDDYLEMFIQFGYVTLFSSAYPLAGLCALLNNMIEVRSDAFKLCFIHQRPFPERVQVSWSRSYLKSLLPSDKNDTLLSSSDSALNSLIPITVN